MLSLADVDACALMPVTDNEMPVTDSEQKAAMEADQRRVRRRLRDTKGDRRRLPLEDLLIRPCRCNMNACYQQFNNDGDKAGIRSVRESFAGLSDDQQDVHISLWIVGRGFQHVMSAPTPAGPAEIMPISEPEASDLVYMGVSDSAPEDCAASRQELADAVGLLPASDPDDADDAAMADDDLKGASHSGRPVRRQAPGSRTLLGR